MMRAIVFRSFRILSRPINFGAPRSTFGQHVRQTQRPIHYHQRGPQSPRDSLYSRRNYSNYTPPQNPYPIPGPPPRTRGARIKDVTIGAIIGSLLTMAIVMGYPIYVQRKFLAIEELSGQAFDNYLAECNVLFEEALAEGDYERARELLWEREKLAMYLTSIRYSNGLGRRENVFEISESGPLPRFPPGHKKAGTESIAEEDTRVFYLAEKDDVPGKADEGRFVISDVVIAVHTEKDDNSLTAQPTTCLRELGGEAKGPEKEVVSLLTTIGVPDLEQDRLGEVLGRFLAVVEIWKKEGRLLGSGMFSLQVSLRNTSYVFFYGGGQIISFAEDYV
ncbi:hypothetical protein F4778DRAFT_73332 [Xylariomycetidae sp. FL2044]|nr:hypothetical protein F4778DRAFT_73332 [Xylariomycetidae sp. FL2044]